MAEFTSDGERLYPSILDQSDEKKDHEDNYSYVSFSNEGTPRYPRDRPLTVGEQLYSGGGSAFNNEGIEGKKKSSFKVTVTDPEKKGEGMYAYISYKINTEYVNSDGQKCTSSVIRRYSDFSWLYEQLYTNFPGMLIPPLPEKAIMGRFGGEFINERKRGLEQFLNRISVHHDLSQSKDVNLFIHGDDVQLSNARDAKAQSFDSKGFVSFFKDSVNAISNSFSGKEREKSQKDLDCEQLTDYAEQLDNSLGGVHSNLECILQKDRTLSKNWFSFGVACKLIGQYEMSQGEEKLGNLFCQLGSTADQLSMSLTKKVEAESLMFREPIKDYVRIIGSVKAMMKTRETAHMSYCTSLSTLEAKQTNLSKVQGVAGKESKALAIEKSLIETQASLDQDKEELEKITASCMAEASRFKKNKSSDFQKIVLVFCKLQIEHCKKVQSAWELIMPVLEEVI